MEKGQKIYSTIQGKHNQSLMFITQKFPIGCLQP